MRQKATKTRVAAAVVVVVALLVAVAGFALRRAPAELSRDQMLKMVVEAGRSADAGDVEHAEQLVRRVLDFDQDHHRARLLLGRILWARGDETAFEQWSMVDDSTGVYASDAHDLHGRALLSQSRPDDAEKQLREALRLNRGNLSAVQALLELYCLQRRPDDIRAMLSLIAETRQLSPAELAMDFVADHAIFSVEESLIVLDRHLQTDPAHEISRLAKAEYLYDAGRFEEAAEQLQQTAESPAVLRSRLRISLSTGDDSTAAKLFHRPETNALSDPRVRIACASFCIRHQDFQTAAELLADVSDVSRLEAAWHHTLGRALDGSSRQQDARTCFASARLADDAQADAFRLIEGHSDRMLLAETMARISRSAYALGDVVRGDAFRLLAVQYDLPPQQISPGASTTIAADSLPVSPDDAAIVRRLGELFDRADSRHSAAIGDQPSNVIQFADIAAEAGIDFTYDNGATGRKLIVESIGGGVAVLDYDLDGWPDLFFSQGGELEGAPVPMKHDRLFRNLGDGSFVDVSQSAGIVATEYHLGCCAFDFDNDGDSDIAVAALYDNLLYINRGDGTFEMRRFANDTRRLSASAAAADFNGDGTLDLWFANYLEQWDRTCRDGDGNYRMCVPTAYPAAADQLLLNDGQGTFQSVDISVDDDIPPGPALGIVALDFSGDGKPDVYTANDFAPNHLYINECTDHTVGFREVAFPNGCAVSDVGRAEAGMGIAVGDFDRNGQPDLFVTNFHSEPNRLYLQSDAHFFQDASAHWRVPEISLPLLGFGVQAEDFDLDGFEDLCITNGDIDDMTATMPGRAWKMPAQVLRNMGGRRFADVSATAGEFFRGRQLGRGLATLDFNRDGLTDVIIVHQDRTAALLENQTVATSGLTIRLIGTVSNRMAVGSRVSVRTRDIVQTRWATAGNGFMASNEPMFRFGGLQSSAEIEVTVKWPDGTVEVLNNIPARADVILIEQSSAPARVIAR